MKYRKTAAILLAVFGLFVCSVAYAEVLPTASPGSVGFSSERLALVKARLQAEVDQGRIPGIVALMARKGKIVFFESFGMQVKSKKLPMKKDAIFRVYSMTKPFVSVVTMMLHEEGKLLLSDPIAKYLPEFKEMIVGELKKNPKTGVEELVEVKAALPITVHDLLRHTSGLTYGVFGRTLVHQAYMKAGIYSGDQTIAEMSKKLGKLPLRFQPQATWEYSRSTDVLGRLLEVVSGQPLDKLMEEKLFRPLGMDDTGFYVQSGNLHRIVQPSKNPKTGKAPNLLDVTKPPKLLAGGQGAVSTVGDYLRFCQMLLNGGSFKGVRIISRKTLEYMTSDHISESAKQTAGWYGPGPGYGFGLGFAVRLDTGQSKWPGTIGDFWWGGYAGTYFWVDPKEELIAIIMTQSPSMRNYSRQLYRYLVYQSFND